ncbi:MAG: tetraacyldisaccharide 4'-kinase [Bacteroidales bacterium]|nr:tetraacyldisaccharide 4'-kinase [Bacteroidales bacterium]
MSFRTTISWMLLPLTLWYAAGVAVRNMLYGMGLLRQESPHVFTIGVGNLSTGGTGKTPMVEHLVRLLSPRYRVALLSRGYKRSTKGFVLCDGTPDPDRIGDEAAMMARKHPEAIVAVCENRIEGINRLMSLANPPQVVLLDDSFQHRRIKPSLNILLTEYAHPYFDDFILPYGNLREFRSARQRANIIVVTKSPARLDPMEKHNIIASLGTKPYQKIFFSYLAYGTPVALADGSPRPLNPSDRLLLVTGIARPEPLLAEMRKTHKVTHLRYADHHRYTQSDIADIATTLEQLGPDGVFVTTEKDAVKLKPLMAALPNVAACYVPIEMHFHPSGDHDIDSQVLQMVQENIQFLFRLKNSPLTNSD